MRIRHHIKQHIFPTPHNGFVPKLLQEKQVLGMLVLGLILFIGSQYARLTNYFGLTATVYPATIVSLTNQDRVTNDLPTLTTNATLEAAAKLKAQDMAAKGYFAHTSPEGRTPWYWFAQAGYSFIYAGENLAINFDDTGAVEEAWLNSPTHRANIMNKNFTEMGVATAVGEYNGRKTTFVVELFGMPATTKVATTPAQSTPKVPTTVAPQPATTTPKPAPVPTIPSTPKPVTTVAGEETSSRIAVLKETPTFSMAQNTDKAIEPGNPAPTSTPKVSWYARFFTKSDKLAGLIMEIMLIAAIIATAGMVAREYEKHHRKHMAYGALMAVILFSSLFVGRLGFFAPSQPLATAPTFDVSVQ